MLPLRQINLSGFRGFNRQATLDLAVPNGKEGSGLTILVGQNNTGKSSVLEAISFLEKPTVPRVTVDRKNKNNYGNIELVYQFENGRTALLHTPPDNSVIFEWSWQGGDDGKPGGFNVLTLGSPRAVDPQSISAMKENGTREHYRQGNGGGQRDMDRSSFDSRIFRAHNNKERFNKLLEQVWGNIPQWKLEPHDVNANNHKLMFGSPSGGPHNKESIGSGLMNAFQIVDTLYDISDDKIELVAIDEPEFALHPAVQRRLLLALGEYARKHQIVIATHSPIFIDWQYLHNGGQLARFVEEAGTNTIHALPAETLALIKPLTTNPARPHTFGADAKEIFFLDDEIILVEGQEDIWGYRLICNQLNIKLQGTFFGWGCDGASNMRKIAGLLHQLGYRRVSGILDSNEVAEHSYLRETFPNYEFVLSPAYDVRTKDASQDRPQHDGLLDRELQVRPEYVDKVIALFSQIDSTFKSRRPQR